ncbi:helix-turn-helix transcriptional regulator [Paraburkholderia metrosideri]|uniref:Helix-turn-helix transcriptional regulator n=1 Tax=Paraburkholderia metrosideri TaxID=580937 RepID=A0ABW9E3C8_9BURK
MKTTVQFCGDMKAKLGIESDYALAKALNVSRSAVSKWTSSKGTFDEDTCFQVADVLGLRPFEVVAAMHAERARDDQHRAFWTDAWENFSKGFRSLVLRANACGALVSQV